MTDQRAIAQQDAPGIDELIHELRTPLNAAQFAVELLGSDPRAEETLRVALRHLKELIEHSGATPCEGQAPVRVTVTEAVLVADPTARVSVSDELDHDARVAARPAVFRQLVVLLLTNALKYSPSHAPVRLTLTNSATAVTVTVSDLGSGLLGIAHDELFSPGWRAPQHDQIAGTGLGLGIARRLARSLDGELCLTETSANGSTFTITLPRS